MFGFTGREHDASGLRYHRDRYLDPSTGKWLQPDRLGLVDGPNLYQYAKSMPTQARDSRGRYIDSQKSDPIQLSLLYQSMASNLGLNLYLYLLRSSFEVRFVTPSVMPSSFWKEPDVSGVTSLLADASPTLECHKYIGVSVDPARAVKDAVPAEATMIHEMRHALDFANTGDMPEVRGYAAGIVAEYELTQDFEAAMRHAKAGPFRIADLDYLRINVFTPAVLDSIQPPP